MNLKISSLFLFFILFLNTSVNSQLKKCEAGFISGEKPEINGVLDDPAWVNNEWSRGFTQYEPYNGADPQCKTEFNLVYDNENIYIGIRAYDLEPEAIEARIARRDAWEGDLIEVHFDSYMDSRTCFVFSVNAAGSIGDNIMYDDGKQKDMNWDPIWEGKADRFDDGWTAELSIPLSQLRFDNSEDQEWGFQVVRWVHRLQEFSTWQPVTKDQFGWASTFGRLTGITDLKPSRRLELIPYTVVKHEAGPAEDFDGHFFPGNNSSIYGGVDSKVEITNDFNLDLTINPDFGQVEADPSVINLTAFETFFPEKRNFFVEGTSIFDFGLQELSGALWQDKLFYSRRIGRKPFAFPDSGEGEYWNLPEMTSILGAAKLTGKTRDGLSIGLMESITSVEKADLIHGNSETEIDVAPLTNYFMGRVQKDYDDGNMSIGGFITAVNRDIDKDYQNVQNRSAYTGAFDFLKMWKDKTYSLKIKGYGSTINGTTDAISYAQRSSLRYYQRPDADYLDFDPDRTSLSGHGGSVSFRKLKKGNWTGWADFFWRSPGLELNDIGFLRNADFKMYNFLLEYREYDPVWIFNNYSIRSSYWDSYTFGNERQLNGAWIGVSAQFRNFWSLSLGHTSEGREDNINILRGGPAVIRPVNRYYTASISSDARKNTIFRLNLNKMSGKYDFQEHMVYSASVVMNPNRNLFISLEPAFQTSSNKLQYLNTIDLDGEKHYLLASVSQKIFHFTTRLYYNITPGLTIQYYGMPFIGSGHYTDYKYAADVKSPQFSERFRSYGEDRLYYHDEVKTYYLDVNGNSNIDFQFRNPDFNSFQFRSSLVLRWEYDPGSTLYFVWTQSRLGTGPEGDFRFGRGFEDLKNTTPDNILLLKISKWFSL
ncbi:MAG: carbohydrate binding family 9 domain-containing protein [bacterium]|nr:carbohydrate binding family 9 domain-containing protein [bacterium]